MTAGERSGTEGSGRGVVPGHQVRLSGEATRVGAPCAGSVGEPKVNLVREGDTVVAIDVTCPCGQRLRLRCVY
jgi:hypothetical protein